MSETSATVVPTGAPAPAVKAKDTGSNLLWYVLLIIIVVALIWVFWGRRSNEGMEVDQQRANQPSYTTWIILILIVIVILAWVFYKKDSK